MRSQRRSRITPQPWRSATSHTTSSRIIARCGLFQQWPLALLIGCGKSPISLLIEAEERRLKERRKRMTLPERGVASFLQKNGTVVRYESYSATDLYRELDSWWCPICIDFHQRNFLRTPRLQPCIYFRHNCCNRHCSCGRSDRLSSSLGFIGN